jgi:hypothetical protein
MSDFTPTTDFSVKDSLPVDDPEKLILGADLDVEFNALQVAIATKYDDTDIATQAQAEAGTSNAVLMTPLRVAQYLTDAGGGGAGVVVDLIGLTDPGADRILFWDESANDTTWLTVGTGLAITATSIASDDSAIVHDNLSGFVANEHIDLSGVTITAGEGLSYSAGGTDLTASATIDLDITELTEETTLDVVADDFVFYDASATAHRKAPIENIIGEALGDGKWYRSSTQALSAATEATIAFNAAESDDLERGTFSTVTGQYTATSITRLWVCASITIAAIDDDDSIEVEIQVGGVTKLRTMFYNDTDNDTPEQTVACMGHLDLPLGTEIVRVRVTTSSAETVSAGTALSNFSIMELA